MALGLSDLSRVTWGGYSKTITFEEEQIKYLQNRNRRKTLCSAPKAVVVAFI